MIGCILPQKECGEVVLAECGHRFLQARRDRRTHKDRVVNQTWWERTIPRCSRFCASLGDLKHFGVQSEPRMRKARRLGPLRTAIRSLYADACSSLELSYNKWFTDVSNRLAVLWD